MLFRSRLLSRHAGEALAAADVVGQLLAVLLVEQRFVIEQIDVRGRVEEAVFGTEGEPFPLSPAKGNAIVPSVGERLNPELGVRNLGGAFGLAVLTTMQTQLFAFHRQELYSAANVADPHVASMIAGQFLWPLLGGCVGGLCARPIERRVVDRDRLVQPDGECTSEVARSEKTDLHGADGSGSRERGRAVSVERSLPKLGHPV